MRLKRWQKVILCGVIWIALVIILSLVPIPNSPIIASIVATVVSLLSPKISDRILDAIFGKEGEEVKLVKEFARETKKLEEKEVRIKELKQQIHEDSNELVDALQEWFKPPPSTKFSFLSNRALNYSLSYVSVVYMPDGKSKPIIHYLEPSWIDSRLIDRIREHLANTDWKLWLKTKQAVDAHLEKIKSFWEVMEEKLRSELLFNCPSMIERYHSGLPPDEYYNMDYCLESVWLGILLDAGRAVKSNATPSVEFFKEDPEDHCKIGIDTTYAQSPDTARRRNFINIVSRILTHFVTEYHRINDERSNIEEMIRELRKAIDARIYDFEHPPYNNLPGNCVRCKSLYEELEKLKSS